MSTTAFKGSPNGKITKANVRRRDIKPDEVLLRITHGGLCATDLHYKYKDMVLGHEGIGVVEEIGTNVTQFKVGDRAGWGYLHFSCLHCDQCLSGHEIFCSEHGMYGEVDLDQGGFSTHAVWKEAFLFHIPNNITSSDAGPFMCAGATVFNALYLGNVRSVDRVGVIGIGGLGHLAIQFAAKMGCGVVVLSGTESKRLEAMELGATEFYPTKNVQELKIGRPLDHLIVTSSRLPDWNLLLPVLAPRATIYPLSFDEGNFSVPHTAALVPGIRIQWSICPSRGAHMKMLRFAAQHKIKPIVQEFPMTVEGIEDAMDKLEKGLIRYRAVIVAGNH